MFKVEFFDSNFSFQCAHFIQEDITLGVDYLTMEAATLSIKGCTQAAKGSYAHITGDIQFDGIVSDVQPGKHVTDISVRPLQAIFDIEVFAEGFEDVARFLYKTINENLVDNPDTYQNLPLAVTNSVPSAGRPITVSERSINVLNLMNAALITYQIAVDCNLDMKNMRINADIKAVTSEKNIEADLDNVVDKTVTLGDSYGSYNKIYIRRTLTDIETGAVTILDTVPFFLHNDGTVSRTDTDRITPVFWTVEELEDSESWDSRALSRATEVLSGQKFDNEIILTYHKKDKVVYPEEMQIGTQTVIYSNFKAYKSILTGKSYYKDTINLVFGAIRVDLTKKIILDRRKKL